MYTVKLENEYLRGAIWVLGEDGITAEGKLPLVEKDLQVLEINEEIAEMYDSYLEFDSHGQGCWFNEEQRKADREKMLSLSSQHSGPGWMRLTTARSLSLTMRRPTCSPCSGAARTYPVSHLIKLE